MKRQLLGVAMLASGIAIGATAQPVGATDLAAGKEALDTMCRDKGGEVYFSPYAITRCQDVRSKKGFEVEAMICEDELGGRFLVGDSQTRNNRANWACVPGPTAP